MAPQSPASLRILEFVDVVLGAGSSLQSLNTQLVMDRGIVACKANNSLYMLRREATDSPSGTDIVVPAAGPGRWFIYPAGSGGGGLAPLGIVNMVAIEGVTFPTSTENTFQPASIIGALTYSGSPSMSLNVDQLVFSEPGTYLVQCTMVINVGAQLASQAFAAVIGFNDDLVGGEYNSGDAMTAGSQTLSVFLAGATATQVGQWIFTLVRRVTVTTPGDFVRALVQAQAVTAADNALWGFTLTALQVAP